LIIKAGFVSIFNLVAASAALSKAHAINRMMVVAA